MVRDAVPLPPRTLASARFFASLVRCAVAPSAMACMKRSTSVRVTAFTFSAPSTGLMCRAMRPLSVARVDGFFATPRRVSSRPPSASAR